MYPTQQIAAAQFAAMGKRFPIKIAGESEAGALGTSGTADAGAGPVVYGSRSSALVTLAFGVDSQETADQLMGQIRYQTSVTWNEPSQSFTDPSFPVMMVGVFEGTGLIMLFALVGGLGFLNNFREKSNNVKPHSDTLLFIRQKRHGHSCLGTLLRQIAL